MSAWDDQEFVRILGLSQSTHKICFENAIKVNSDQDLNPTTVSEWPMYMLKLIMGVGVRILEMPKGIITEEALKDNFNGNSTATDSSSEDESVDAIHPMDVFLYLFFTCDRVFRQTFCSQVAKCQLALPLIAIDPLSNRPTFYIFALKTLIKDCYTLNNHSKSFSVTNEKLPIISFVRLGDCNDSNKSKILNEIMGLNHSYFFDRDCRDYTKENCYLNGTVEIGWHLPGKTERIIDKQFVILNLRGDAARYLEQLNFLAKVSTFLCIFTSYHQINNNIQQVIDIKKNYEDKLLYIVYKYPHKDSKKCNLLEYLNYGKQLLVLKDINVNQKSTIICNKINSLLISREPIISLTDCVEIARQFQISVDSDDEVLTICNNGVQDVLEYLRSSLHIYNSEGKIALAEFKQVNLPLQGKPWKKWADSHRKMFLLKTDNMEKSLLENKKDLEKSMCQARDEQFELLNNPSSLLKISLKLISNQMLLDGSNVYIKVWKLLQNELNAISLEYLPILHEKFKTVLAKLRDNYNDNNQREIRQVEIQNTAKEIINSSFGIEHFFREFGQVYETYIHFNSKQSYLNNILNCKIEKLPQLVAELILAGHSFEIMDGDANHVPQTWVSQVLKCLTKLIGTNKRIFVLSILGTQSSGKSTLLNTMFGVDFAVSAGRCTRGVFMQLIPINENLAHKLGYDYIVLLDTEGLRAREQLGTSNYRYDNELATFVIGLADLTLVIIFGELYTEIKDILQITVMAFLRMNIAVKKKPKCIFVHQNVGNINAPDRLLNLKSSLEASLNDKTEIAAKQEKKDALFKQFHDVIEFDFESDVFYFPGLDDGEPPMTRVSAGYSNSAKALKYKILNIFKTKKQNDFQSFNDWEHKIEEIWESVIKENFAFSYRNILELHCRFELDSALCDWSSEYCRSMLAYKSDRLNILLNSSSANLDQQFLTLKSALLKYSEENGKDREKILKEKYFESHNNKEMFLHWKNVADSHFITVRSKERERTSSAWERVVNMQREKFKMEMEFIKFKDDIVSKTVEFFKEIKENKVTNLVALKAIFETKFEKLWIEWSSRFTLINSQLYNIALDCQNALIGSHYLQSMRLVSDEMALLSNLDNYRITGKNEFQELFATNNYTIYNQNRRRLSFLSLRKKNTKEMFQKLLEQLSNQVDVYLSDIVKENFQYSPEIFSILINYIYREIEAINKEQREGHESILIELSSDFIFNFTFYQCRKAITLFENQQDSFESNISLKTKLNRFKDEVKEFSLNCLTNQSEHYCAEQLVKVLSSPMKDCLSQNAIGSISKQFHEDPINKTIMNSRATLQLCVLKELADNLNFDEYISYIKSPIDYLSKWISHRIQNYVHDEKVLNNFLPILKEEIDTLYKQYITAAEKATLETASASDLCRWDNWKSIFHSELLSIICGLQQSDLMLLDICLISNYEQFLIFFSEILKSETDNYKSLAWLKEIVQRNNLLETSSYDACYEYLLQCKNLCPFCSEPCRYAIGCHEHYCGPFHRPQGINGIRIITTQIICIEECTTCILKNLTYKHSDGKSYMFEDYRTINDNFKSWKILGEDAIEAKYWQWVLYTFQDKFLTYYNIEPNPEIEHFSHLTKEYVIQDLEKQINDFETRLAK